MTKIKRKLLFHPSCIPSMTKSESSTNEPLRETTKSKLRRFQKLKRKLRTLSKLRKMSQKAKNLQTPTQLLLSSETQTTQTEIVIQPQDPQQNEAKPQIEEKQSMFTKENIEKLLMDKLRKPQGNHLLQKLVSHVADRLSEEKVASIENSQITAKMIKESLCGEIVNFGRKNNFSAEEDAIILRLIAKMGKNWKEISCLLKNKTPNMVKNRYYTYLKKRFDQKYNDMVSLHSLSTESSSIKIEEEPLLKVFQENTRRKAEMDHELKMKTLAELFRVNQVLDLEKKKILMNIVQLHKSIAKDKERKTTFLDKGFHQSQSGFQKLMGNFIDLPQILGSSRGNISQATDINRLLAKEQNSTINNQNHVGSQINNLENVIKDALKQLHSLKSTCGGL